MAPLRQVYLTAPEWEAVGGQPLVAGVGVPVSSRAPPAGPGGDRLETLPSLLAPAPAFSCIPGQGGTRRREKLPNARNCGAGSSPSVEGRDLESTGRSTRPVAAPLEPRLPVAASAPALSGERTDRRPACCSQGLAVLFPKPPRSVPPGSVDHGRVPTPGGTGRVEHSYRPTLFPSQWSSVHTGSSPKALSTGHRRAGGARGVPADPGPGRDDGSPGAASRAHVAQSRAKVAARPRSHVRPPPSFSLCSLHRVPRLGPRWHLWPDRARPGSAPGSSWVRRHQGHPSLLPRPGSPPRRPHRCVSGHRTGSPEFRIPPRRPLPAASGQ
ncbi:translation initiation factor IF-2-like [Leopardus geoffroyi]|uniref:translation initiation factor IF-2-like n=1 Tax=Leopardus geoffroyi TaxID=46844 RepID=UPI001E263656|nr:translation initiation factor IF-2-like [Leopardus geoffroyi]